MVVLIRESLPNLVETKDLGTVTELEACLAGQVVVPDEQLQSFTPAPAGSQPPYGGWGSPCGELMKNRPAQVVYGPGTFLNRAVAAVNTQIQAMLTQARQAVATAEHDARQLALGQGLSSAQALDAERAAGALEQQQQSQQLAQLYLDSGISGTPRIDDPQFIPEIVFDQSRGVNQPKARFSYLFPTASSALIQVRLKPSLSYAQQARAISWIRQAVRMPMFRSAYGGSYTVTGEPVLTADLASYITGSIARLLVAVVLVMAATLLIVFQNRPRLLPLAIALAAAGVTFGATALVGASLTLAAIAVLPILIGLAVDYAIQFQSRVAEARQATTDELTPAETVANAAVLGVPTIATAALATATGFLVLLLSPVPMVRGFGLLLVVGVAIALACTLTAGSAAIALTARGRASSGPSGGRMIARSVQGAAEILHDAAASVRSAAVSVRGPAEIGRGAVEILRDAGGWVLSGFAAMRERIARRLPWSWPGSAVAGWRILTLAVNRPGRVLAVAAGIALLGWIADTQTSVQSDVTKLVPSSMPALRDLRTLERVTGVSGEIDVTVRASNVATPRTIGWMVSYENELLHHYGYLESSGCVRSTLLCPALSLPDLFSTGGQSGQGSGTPLTKASINSLLGAVPGYFSQAVITPDRQEAALAFGIRLMPLSRQQQVINYMRSQLHPPAGVTARLAGLPVLAAEANTALSSSGRRLLTMVAALLAVALVLLAVFRSVERALVPMIPIALATGWSALVLFLIGIPLNPMSATLGALVIAVSTEFAVLLSERFRQERRAGHELTDALDRTYQFTGAAVLASGITAIAGFGVLVLSSITMLRDFGFVTLVDLTVSLAGVMLVLPSVLALAERGDVVESARRAIRRAGSVLPRPRRRARVA